jgi:4-amino-4-deoxy-L-arabinose transferase-like glycosyltransferase
MRAHTVTRPLRSLRIMLGKAPTAAWVCAFVAFLNAACWSLITPPFQVPDEPAHVAYVREIAEAGRLPSGSGEDLSAEEESVVEALHVARIREQQENQPISSQPEQDQLEHELERAERSSEKGGTEAGVAASQPPLFYVLQAIPYTLAGGTLLDRLELMRLLSALMGGLTALFVFLFIRETLPGVPWAWTVGALSVALVPLLGFMSGAVNPDALLFAVSAALFYCLARAFRRGLTRQSAVALGAVTAVGFTTKLNFIGMTPGVLLGLIVLAVRAAHTSRRAAYRSLAIAISIAVCPVIVYVIIHLTSGHPALGVASSSIDSTGGSVLEELNYIWQLFLPRLPGTSNDFPGVFTTRQIWFNGYIGLYGWLDTTFPGWLYDLALIPAALIAGLCIRELFSRRVALRARVAELIVYLAMGAGLMVLIGASSYEEFPKLEAEFGQTRYLLPLLPLLGAALAMAARGAGRRLGPAVGTLIVVLFLAHDLFSQLQVIARFYG